MIEIAAGDTIFGLSKKYQVPLQDLIKQNDLTPPYQLKAGSKLTIPSSNYHHVKPGETIYGISRAYNMNINSLVSLNKLESPYNIKPGDKIKVSGKFADSSDSPSKTSYHLSGSIKKTPEKTPVFTEKTIGKFNLFSGRFVWPVRGEIVSRFGPKQGGLYNDGINIKAREGSDVKSAESGLVAYVGNELKGYGNLVIIKHDSGWITAYAHLKEMLVNRRQKIAKGQKIGTVGATGNVNTPQLYFGLRKGRDAVNPENYLK